MAMSSRPRFGNKSNLTLHQTCSFRNVKVVGLFAFLLFFKKNKRCQKLSYFLGQGNKNAKYY
uniref:Uncharacterized protein n=1 Tax=Anguilla anguilla TaxID=7936 RepID=A0A0E9RI02_ANGAN